MEEVFNIDYFTITVRLLLAAILGGIIGYEREYHNHPAGFRTHILVSIGSTLIMLISIYGFKDFLVYESINFDPSRIAAQVVTGIGFLGAGTILRHGFNVTGLTTAASLWVVAGIGLAIGTGFYYGAILTTVLVVISLAILAKFDPYITKKRQFIRLKVYVLDKPGILGEIATNFGERKINVKNVNIQDEESDEDGMTYVSITFLLQIPRGQNSALLVDDIRQITGVKEIFLGDNAE